MTIDAMLRAKAHDRVAAAAHGRPRLRVRSFTEAGSGTGQPYHADWLVTAIGQAIDAATHLAVGDTGDLYVQTDAVAITVLVDPPAPITPST